MIRGAYKKAARQNTYGGRKESSKWIRYKNGFWIPSRKRNYLYWFKFLQHAEQSSAHQVDWTKYPGWGGANEVLGSRFDEWWEPRWEKMFAFPTRTPDQTKGKFLLSTNKPKTEAIRMALLVYEYRNTKPDMTRRITAGGGSGRTSDEATRKPSPRLGGKTLAIAKKVVSHEKGKARHTDLWSIEIDGDAAAWEGILEQEVQGTIGRYMRNAKKILGNVSEGCFP